MGGSQTTKMARICLYVAFLGVAVAAPVSDPVQPHLAQAWTAMSSGDGLPGQIGFESYLYEGNKAPGAVRGHIWDYGETCKKIEVSINDKHALQGTFYLKCDGGVDCCFSTQDGRGGDKPVRPDVKGWDIAKNNLLHRVEYIGTHDIKDLYNDVPNAETWFEKDHIPFTNVGVNYTYYITRNGSDIISHRIHYTAPTVSPGDILYGNFTVQKDIESFRKVFTPPDVCYPQGSGKGHALSCDGNKVAEWERKYFKHSAASKGYAQPATCNITVFQGKRFHAGTQGPNLVRGLTQDECCAKCEADSGCLGFAYEAPDLRDIFRSRCEIHTAETGFGGKINSTHWVCGKK